MSLDYYNSFEKQWLSPRHLLLYYNEFIKKYGESSLKKAKYKKIVEARDTAINLLGMQKHDPKNYFIQVPKEKNESPDIVTMFLEEVEQKPVQLRLLEVEVVEYREEERRDLLTFLLEEKLSPSLSKKAYDSDTTILCSVVKNISINGEYLFQELEKIKPVPPVLLLQNISGQFYRTIQVWPSFGFIDYDIYEEERKPTISDTLKLSLGTKGKINMRKSDLPKPTIEDVFEIT